MALERVLNKVFCQESKFVKDHVFKFNGVEQMPTIDQRIGDLFFLRLSEAIRGE